MPKVLKLVAVLMGGIKMEEFIILIIQGFFEIFLQIFISHPFDLPSKKKSAPETIWPFSILWFIGGCLLAWLSLFLFKHTFIPISGLRIANLILSPVVAAYISGAIARRRAKTNDFVVPRDHFGLAFWFTLGFAAIRFAYATHMPG